MSKRKQAKKNPARREKQTLDNGEQRSVQGAEQRARARHNVEISGNVRVLRQPLPAIALVAFSPFSSSQWKTTSHPAIEARASSQFSR